MTRATSASCTGTCVAVCAGLVWTSPVAAQAWVDLDVHAARVTTPALQTQLATPAADERDGNAAVTWLKVLAVAPDAATVDGWAMLTDAELRDPVVRTERDLTAMLGGTGLWTLARRAATVRQCDWQTAFGVGSGLDEVPEAIPLRSVAKLLSTQVRLQAVDGDVDGALESLRIGFALSRDLGEGPTLLQRLIGSACATMFVERVADVGRVPDAPNFYWALTDLPDPLIDLRGALRHERDLVATYVPEIRLIRDGGVAPEEWPELARAITRRIDAMTGTTEPTTEWALAAFAAATYPSAKVRLLERGVDRAVVDAMPVTQAVLLYALDEYAVWRDEIYKWAALPYPIALPGLYEVQAQLDDSGDDVWVFIALLPSVSRVLGAQGGLDRRIAAQRIIEALRDHAARTGGFPERLDVIDGLPIPVDPLTGHPFHYRRVTPREAELAADVAAGQPAWSAIRLRIHLVN